MDNLGCCTPLNLEAMEARYLIGYRVFSISLQFSGSGGRTLDQVRTELVNVCQVFRERHQDVQFVVRPTWVSASLTKIGEGSKAELHHIKSQLDLAVEIGATSYILKLGDSIPPEPSRGVSLDRISGSIHELSEGLPLTFMVENTRGSSGGTDIGSLSFLLSLFDSGNTNICFNPTAAWSRGEHCVLHKSGEMDRERLSQLSSFLRQAVRAVVLSPLSEGVPFGSHVENSLESLPLSRGHLRPDFLGWLVSRCSSRGVPVIVEGNQASEETLNENFRQLTEWSQHV